MKKLFNFLKKSVTLAVLCLIITTTLTLPPVPDFDSDNEYGTCVIPGSGGGDDDERPLDGFEDD